MIRNIWSLGSVLVSLKAISCGIAVSRSDQSDDPVWLMRFAMRLTSLCAGS